MLHRRRKIWGGLNARVGVNGPSEAQEAASGVWGNVSSEKF